MREFIRHPSSIPVLLEKVGDHNPGMQTLNNVSIGGVCCYSEIQVDKGINVSMCIECIDPDFKITGKVIWCNKKEDSYELGIEFITSKANTHHLRMIEQVCHIEHYRKEVEQNEDRILTSEEAAKEWIEKYAERFPRV